MKCEQCKQKDELKNMAICEDCGQLTALGVETAKQMENINPSNTQRCLMNGKRSYVVCRCKNCI